MRPLAIFVFVCMIMGIALFIGKIKEDTLTRISAAEKQVSTVPHIGRIEVLNGCGITGAATAVADYLRSHQFDVKNTGDAETWNYPFTMVIAHTADMTIARQVSQTLSTDKLLQIRDNNDLHDVTVILGPDFGERIN